MHGKTTVPSVETVITAVKFRNNKNILKNLITAIKSCNNKNILKNLIAAIKSCNNKTRELSAKQLPGLLYYKNHEIVACFKKANTDKLKVNKKI